MDGEVVLVAVDASKEITDYALEWAVRNVIKPMDSLILLAILPRRELPQITIGNQPNHSQVYQFVSSLLRMRSIGHTEQTSFDKSGFDDGHDVAQRINQVCVHMMKQLISIHNVAQVVTKVKVVNDAQMGSVSMAAEKLGATWVILDRRLKKEGDCCLKRLNCNIVLIDHAIPKILRSTKSPNMKRLNAGDEVSYPTVADMLGVLPSYNHDSQSSTTRSSVGSDGLRSNTSVSYFSSSSINKDRLNSKFSGQIVKTEAMYNYKPSYSKSQPLSKVSIFDSESPRKSTTSTTHEKTKSHNNVVKTKTGELAGLPTYNSDSQSSKTRSTPDSDGHSSNIDVSSSSSNIDKDQSQDIGLLASRLPTTNSSAQLNSRFLSQTMETESMDSSNPPYTKSQPLSKLSTFDYQSPRGSTTKSHRSPLKTKNAMPGVLRNDDSESSTTGSSIGSFSSSSIDKDQSQKISPLSRRSPAANSYAQFNSQFHNQKVENEAMYKSQSLSKGSMLDSEFPNKSTIKSHNNILKTKSDSADMNIISSIRGTQPASTPPRRSIDIRIPTQSRQFNTRRESTSMSRNTGEMTKLPSAPTLGRSSSVRRAMSLSMKQPPKPPPLCSFCKHNTPIFGTSPRRFSYKEIEKATNGFSEINLLAEGGFGKVYRGVLVDGQVVAVKKHVALSAQGASEFCSEVEVLSCAQHRNLVMLVGYCIEIEWLLVYEYACNGSLDKHLYGTEKNEVMAWENRMKVALGAARGLRYLHEDCRVGCIVHRDFRPTNILLTHDFEPMVGDFGLARWQADGQSAEETRVIGAFGYLAPEYTQTGLITEKADVYAFGVVLLELLTGTKATEFSRIGGSQYLPEWGHVLLGKKQCNEIIDPCLENNYSKKEVETMMYAASLCISPHPERRPRMSKILRILEGDMPNNMAYHHRKSTSSTYTRQSIHHLNLSPSRESSHTFNARNKVFKPPTPTNGHKMAKECLEFQKSELLGSEEYQEYLQGSLSKFINNLTVK